MRVLYFEGRMVAEGASAVGLAAVLSGKVKVTGPAATVVTGRNVDMGLFGAIMAGQDVTLGGVTVRGRVYGA